MQKSREQKTTLRLAEGARWESNIFSFGSGCRYPRGISYYFSFVIISSCIRLLYFFTSSLAPSSSGGSLLLLVQLQMLRPLNARLPLLPPLLQIANARSVRVKQKWKRPEDRRLIHCLPIFCLISFVSWLHKSTHSATNFVSLASLLPPWLPYASSGLKQKTFLEKVFASVYPFHTARVVNFNKLQPISINLRI